MEAYQLRPHTGSLAPHAMDTSQHGPQDWLGDDGDSQPCEDYWWLKLPAKFLFYGRNMKQWQIRTTAQWPSCQWDNEGKAHIFLSPEEVACQLWTAALHNVFTWQQRANMKLLLWQDLIVLCWWHDGEEVSWGPNPLMAAGRDQHDDICQHLALEGCISCS